MKAWIDSTDARSRSGHLRRWRAAPVLLTGLALVTGALLLGTATPAWAKTPTTTLTSQLLGHPSVNYGSTVGFAAEVSASSGIPGGTVTFSVGSVTLCSDTLFPRELVILHHAASGFGEAVCSSTKAPVGDDTVTATYGGSSTYSSSSATTKLVVDSRKTTTTVTVSPSAAGVGSAITYHATVTGAGTDPTGSVTFSLTGMSGDSAGTFPVTTTACSHGLSSGSTSCTANAPSSDGSSADVIDTSKDVTATYVPSGVAHLGSTTKATLDVMQWGGEQSNLDSSTLNAVSCATTKFCVAVDASGDALNYSSGTWSSPYQVDSNVPDYGLTSVSCPTTRFCAAVGANGSDGSGSVVMYNGSSWTQPQTIAPSPPSPEGYIGLVAVSCASSAFCMAADAYGNAYYYNGSSWSGPTALGLSTRDAIVSLSCTAPDDCSAVTGSGLRASFVGTGIAIFLPVAGGGVTSYSSVSCVKGGSCTAVGANNASGAEVTFPGASLHHSSHPPTAVSCATSTFCVAVGDGNSGNDNSSEPFEVTYAGGSWSSTSDIDAFGPELSSISCPSTTFCMAVGGTQAVHGIG